MATTANHIADWCRNDLAHRPTTDIGTRYYSETELLGMFPAARMTIRGAINQLVTDGMLEPVHGSGTYIRRLTPQPATPRHSVSVTGIVFDKNDHTLVIRRADNGQWQPPGGILELNETPEAAVEREVLEETGLHVTVGHLTGVYKNMTIGVVNLTFRCRPQSGALSTTDEAVAVDWHSITQVYSEMVPAFYRRVADAYGAFGEYGPPVRSHDGVNLL